MDIKYSGLFETGVGDFDVNANVVMMDEYNSEAFFNGPMVDFVGLTSIPEMRYTIDVGHELMTNINCISHFWNRSKTNKVNHWTIKECFRVILIHHYYISIDIKVTYTCFK